MTKREATRHAHGQVYAIIQSHMDSDSDFEIDRDDDAAREKVIDALNKMAQRHFELWKPVKKKR